MRGLIFILLFSISVQSQEIDSLLVPYVDEYIQSANDYEIDVRSKLWGLRSIRYEGLKTGYLGIYVLDDVLINRIYIGDSLMTRAILYHEFGHVMGLEHLCKQCYLIMSATADHMDFGNMDNEEWERYKRMYYRNIIEQNNLIKSKVIKNGKNNR